ncbi:MAG: hypothetical protein KF770_31765, partial [Anaerolineae bacterium]|nr:hypothetical protein [Anaerolineae bacterium]
MKRFFSMASILTISALIFSFGLTPDSAAQTAPNPTPIVIDLTPSPPPLPTPGGGDNTPPPPGAVTPDHLEVNDTAEMATILGFQVEPGLTLGGDDVDYFTGYIKAGQWVFIGTTVSDGLDTELAVYWQGTLLAQNDDRSPTDLGSAVTFPAPGDGWYLARVQKVAAFDGRYDLEVRLTEPTATPTPFPTLTPTLTPTPLPTITPAVPPDLAEPNNEPAQAYPIVPGTDYGFSLGMGDID